MALKVGVICKSCGNGIEIEDEYVSGLRGVQMATSLYKPTGGMAVNLANAAWQRTLICAIANCGKTHEYRGADLLIYDDQAD